MSELARKKLVDGDTLPKYHDGMRIDIKMQEAYMDKYNDEGDDKGKEFLTKLETRRGEVETYKGMEEQVMKNFDKDKDGFGLQGADGLNKEHLKKFLQEALCSKKDNINELIYEVAKKVNKVEEIEQSSNMNKNNDKKRSFSGEMQESNKCYASRYLALNTGFCPTLDESFRKTKH